MPPIRHRNRQIAADLSKDGWQAHLPLGRHRSGVHGAHRACEPTLRFQAAEVLAALGIVGQLVFGIYRAGQLWMRAAIRQLRLPSCTVGMPIVARDRVGAATRAVHRQRAARTAVPDAWNSTGAARCRLRRLSEHHLRPARSGPNRPCPVPGITADPADSLDHAAPVSALILGFHPWPGGARAGSDFKRCTVGDHSREPRCSRDCVAAAQGTTAPASASAGHQKASTRRRGLYRIPAPE